MSLELGLFLLLLIVGFAFLAWWIWTLVSILKSRIPGWAKVIWVIFLLFFELITMIVWLIVRPKKKVGKRR